MISTISSQDHVLRRDWPTHTAALDGASVVSIGRLIRNMVPVWNAALAPTHRIVCEIDDTSGLHIAVQMGAFAYAAWAFWELARLNSGIEKSFRLTAEARRLDDGPFDDAVVISLMDAGHATRDHRKRWGMRPADFTALRATHALFESGRGYARLVPQPQGRQSLVWHFPHIRAVP